MATDVSLVRSSAAPKNSTFIVNDILLYARRAETASGSPKKTCECTEWQGRRPWRCSVQMCVKNKTSSARENAFRPASSINDSSFPPGILNNLPPPSSHPSQTYPFASKRRSARRDDRNRRYESYEDEENEMGNEKKKKKKKFLWSRLEKIKEG